MKRKVMIALNAAWNLVNFRSGLIRALVGAGYEVIAVAPDDKHSQRVVALGCRFIPLQMDSKGTHPLKDAILLVRFWRLLRRERPDIYLGYTVKPNIYGSLAAQSLGIPVINNIAGLGSTFTVDNWLTKLVRWMYRLALSRSIRVFFQNEDDRMLFVEGELVSATVTDCLPGSGIDLKHFSLESVVEHDDVRCRFLLIARMLWEKGVAEYVEAARIIRRNHSDIEFCLLGFLDVQSPAAISAAQMERWVAEGVVEYLGEADDVRPYIAGSDCIVLPSFYREGTPHTLLEAAAMGRPIITTDSVGCREVVDEGQNGYMCKVRDSVDLAEKLSRFLDLSKSERSQMGVLGRKKMEREFDEQIVIRKYLSVVDETAN